MNVKSFAEKLQNHPWTQSFLQTVYDTKVEVVIGALAVGSLGFGYSYNSNKQKEKSIPVAFSEIEKTARFHGYSNKDVPALTEHYSYTNDLSMKVFEAWNKSYHWNEFGDKFAYELEKKTSPELRVHATMRETAEKITHNKNINAVVARMNTMEQHLQPLVSALENSWTDTHSDNYTTHIVYSTDDKGNTTMSTESVYSDTDHTYDYNQQQGEKADILLKQFKEKYPNTIIAEKLVLATETEAENEEIIRNSRKKDGLVPKTQEEYIDLANTWAKSSLYNRHFGSVQKNHRHLIQNMPLWSKAKQTAQSVSYNTYSSIDNGPAEFQVSREILGYAKNMLNKSRRITQGIKFSQNHAVELANTAEEFVNVSLHDKPGNADSLQKRTMELAKDMYRNNFESGMNIDRFDTNEVALMTLGGIAAGALAGLAADKVIDNRVGRRRRRNPWDRHYY
jgi:hypothetical protein